MVQGSREASDGQITSAPAVSPLSTYLTSGWPMAYLVATIIVGIGVAIAGIVCVSQPMHITAHSRPVTQKQQAVAPKTEIVGRITGMVDCRWVDRNTKAVPDVLVPLGQKYTLVSGLMEITYDTGAKVILQGPLTYDVESRNGGFMSFGKLTGKVSNETAKGFMVRTPTATVIDLGTEFGVEVSKGGNTKSHVFRGVVEVQPVTASGKSGQAMRLTANESVQVELANDGQMPIVRRVAIDPTAFVRPEQLSKAVEELKLKPFRCWQVYSQELRRDPSLLAYYDFQQKKGESAVLPNVAANGDKSLDGAVETAVWSTGRMVGKHALLFLGGPDELVRLDLPQKVEDLTLAAWVNVASLDNDLNGLLGSDDWVKDGRIRWQVDSNGCMGLVVRDFSGRVPDRSSTVSVQSTTYDAYAGFHTTDNTATQMWQYMETVTPGANGSYTLLPTYGPTPYHGMGWWGTPMSQTDVTGETDGTIKVSPYWNGTDRRGPVIAWKSPGVGSVDVSFSLRELSGISDSSTIPRDGLDYHLFVQGNPTELAGGYLPGARSIGPVRVTGVAVSQGTMLYLQFGPGKVNHWHDFAAVTCTITGKLQIIPESSSLVMPASPLVDRGRFLNRWVQLASVYDHSAARVRFYIDGEAMGEAEIVHHVPMCIGTAKIGQWDRHRNFRGRIDELAIFGRPLTADEVRKMFEAGRPSGAENGKRQH